MPWQFERSKAALPSSYLWTWDHSCNWVLDDPGILNFGCNNTYLKLPETYLEDYRRLTDLAAGLGIKGIVIWGFLRDSHGGVDHAKRICEYSASRGVAILPGVGLTWYGGMYFEGNHRFNIETFLRKYPEARMVTGKSTSGAPGARLPGDVGACPLHPAFQEWMREGLQWLMREFAIGGVNLENGDFMHCECPRCQEHRRTSDNDDPEFFRAQAVTYEPAVAALKDHLDSKLISWATYTSFSFGLPLRHPDPNWPYIGKKSPNMLQRIDQKSIAQFTLTGVVHEPALPLATYLDDGSPAAAFDNPFWPKTLRPQIARSTGFLHQASQWTKKGPSGRYQQIISTIKEGCLRGAASGLEGISVHGEVTNRCIPWALNYLAFSHFTHRPQDTLRQFGRETLGRVLGSEADGESFIEYLAAAESRSLTDSQTNDIRQHMRKHQRAASLARAGADLWPMHFWYWLHCIATGITEPHTASFY